MSFKTVSVIGLGYIGLPTAAMFASRKVKVIGIDVSEHVVNTINQGEIHIVEPELDMLVHATVAEGYLEASTNPVNADAFLIAVPTPFQEGHKPDLSFIESAAKAIAPVLKRGDLVILESTSPVGATEKMSEWLAEARSDLTFPHQVNVNPDINIAHCPERVLPGQVVRELVQNDRVVGGMTPKCSERACELYRIFVQGECIVTNARTAEMAKLTENSFRDVNIAFANELSVICSDLDINVWELIKLANRHPRVNILQPGPGVGGHCIAVDPWFIVDSSPENARLIHMARKVNDEKPLWVIEKVKSEISKFQFQNDKDSNYRVTVALYGLAFKPDIDDLRESPAVYISKKLNDELSVNLIAVEPNINELPISLTRIELVSLEEAIAKADVHVILVDHKEFKIESKFLNLPHCIDTKGITC